MIKPACLKKNDKVAIVAPSVAAKKDSVNRAVKTVRQLGLKPVVCPSCYLIGDRDPVPAQARAKDIMAAFLDDSIKGLVALKAELGIFDLLGHLDYEAIKAHPKAVLGFSDVTGLLLALHTRSGLVAFHGPTATTNIRLKGPGGTGIEPYTRDSLEKALFRPAPMGRMDNPDGEEFQVLREGRARGMLVGGNLTILSQFLGTPYELDTRGKILFMEDVGESLDSVRTMLGTLRDAGKFRGCAGLLVGPWVACAGELPEQERKAALERAVLEAVDGLDIPVMANVRSGHSVPMMTFPMGVEFRMDTREKLIECLESPTAEGTE